VVNVFMVFFLEPPSRNNEQAGREPKMNTNNNARTRDNMCKMLCYIRNFSKASAGKKDSAESF